MADRKRSAKTTHIFQAQQPDRRAQMQTKNLFQTLSAVIAVTVLTAIVACASGNSSGRPGGRPQGPPPEAIKACEGQQEGNTVSFTGRGNETLSGTCQTIEGQLVAVPEGHKPRQ